MGDVILKIIVLSIGLLALIESIVIMLFPKTMIKLGKAWMKHVKAMRKIAIVEFILALIFVLLAIFVL